MVLDPVDTSHDGVRVKKPYQGDINDLQSFRYPRSEPDCMTRLVSEHGPPHIRSPFATAAPTSRLRRLGSGGRGPFFDFGASRHGVHRLVHLDPPGLIRPWKIVVFGWSVSSGRLHNGAFEHDAGGHIFPERDQQLSRQRHDRGFAQAATVQLDPFVEPQGERRMRLMAQP
jgi:hypothetical protein